jgi:protein-S-isoprenylcysteine O-methyltransferase Ste14
MLSLWQHAPMTAQSHDIAGVVIRPPLLYGGALLLALVIDRFLPLAIVGAAMSSWWRIAAGCALAGLGVAIAASAMRSFASVGTPVPTWQPSTALAIAGPYRWSRNPIYLGLTTIYLGVTLATDCAWALIALAPVLAIMRYGVIAREERYLERRFGAAYNEYRARVRRFL